ncbi:MAG TPA: hypothetical protein PKW80_06555 [Bacteroidales bacterium]|nr:hypothetical protein [Bacteroidales bacterium]
MKKIILLVSILLIVATSCKTVPVAYLKTGGIHKKSNVPDSLITKNETFAYYKKDSNTVIVPYNDITFSLKNDTAELDRAKIKKIKKDRSDKEKTYLMERKQKIKNGKSNKKYSFVLTDKYFYKFNVGNLIYDISVLALDAVVIALVNAGGASSALLLISLRPVHEKKFVIDEKCDSTGNGYGLSFHKKILLRTEIVCRKDEIKDSVVIVENLPEGIKMDNYKVKIKQGLNIVQEVQYKEKTKDGKNYCQFKIIPKNGSFKETCIVWIIMDITITPTKENMTNYF